MQLRIFSKKHNLYTNSPLWPSNQISTSDWLLAPNGDVVEAIDEFALERHNPRDFAIEVWTGYFDKNNKKIYRGDVIKLSCFNLDYEVVWSFDRFKMKALYEVDTKNFPDNLYSWGTSVDLATNYEIVGNIHGCNYQECE